MSERVKRNGRTDSIIEGGKRYYTICKCGKEKERYKTPMCRSCNNEYLRQIRLTRDDWSLIKIKDIKDLRTPKDRTFENPYDTILIEFVDRIERRDGIASMHDIFVIMITLFNHYGHNKDIDNQPVNIQLSIMWEYLKEKRKKVTFLT